MIEEAVAKFHEVDPMIALLVFVTYVIMDALFCWYTISVTKRNRVQTANTGMMMYILLGFGTINYVANGWYVVPMAVGAWLGNYFAIDIIDKLENKGASDG